MTIACNNFFVQKSSAMTSFVADVLVTAGKLENIDLNEKVADIQKEIAKLKNDVKDFIDDNYIEFVPTLKKDQALVLEAEKLVDAMTILQRRVQDQIKIELSGSTRELKDLSNALKESSLSLQLSSQLLELSECLKRVESRKHEKKYVEAAETLRRIKSLLETPHSDLQMLSIHAMMRIEYSSSYATFQNDVISLWEQYVSWSESRENGKESASLTMNCDRDEIQDLVKALHYVDSLKISLNDFSNRVLKYLVAPIINCDECNVYVVDERIFNVEHGDNKKKPGYQSVLHNLKLLLQFLHQHLDVEITNDQSFMVLLSGTLLEPLSQKLIHDCISDTIPSSSAELENFEEVMNDINEFQDYLLKIGFISENQKFLSEYTKNVDTLFIDKICQGLLAKASQIARKDLHDSFRHEPTEPLKFSDEVLDDYYKIDRKLSKHTFQLPPCQISKSAKDLLNLARDILEEACTSSDVCAVRLFYTSRNVFEIYASTIPEYHKKFLETIPQQVALFHNNCMYLAHHLLSLAHEYRDRLPPHRQKHNVTYADLTAVLRSVGSECFLDHMKYQRNIIIDILRESGLSQLGQAPELPQSTERALRQCIRQLELLKTVWSDVLPINIYCCAVGCITNSMVEDLVTKVITVEDIPADVASELVTLFSMIVKRTPSIFPESTSIQRHVSKWSKLTELIKVLEASLKDIEDRWADGKGPLAHEFTASQVKRLIRALFQNTERRSTLLANIK